MFSAIFTLATLALAALAKDVTINTPKAVTQCNEVVLTWQDGQAPYNVSVVPGDDPCDEALVELPQTNDTWYHWQNPAIAPGTKIIFAIEDATGEEAWSGVVTVQKGTTSSCTASASSASSTSTPSGTTLAVPPATTNGVTNSESGTPDSPVANPGSSISAAPSTKGGRLVAVGAGLIALASVAVVF